MSVCARRLAVVSLCAFACQLDSPAEVEPELASAELHQTTASANLTTSGGNSQEQLAIDAYRAQTERLRVLEVEVIDAQGRAFKLWAEGQKELADARIRNVAAAIKELAARQIALDARVIESMQRYTLQRMKRIDRSHRISVGIRRDGVLSPERITALKMFFSEGAIGVSRDAMLGNALKELKATKPDKYKGILDDEGEIIALPQSAFAPRKRESVRETYLLQVPAKPPKNDGLWELHLRPRWEGEFNAGVTVRPCDGDRMPTDGVLAEARISYQGSRPVTEKQGYGRWEREVVVDTRPPTRRGSMLLNADLTPGSWVWVRIRGGASAGDKRVPLRPDFFFVEADLTGKTSSSGVTTEKPAPKERIPELPPHSIAFAGGDVVELLRFCVNNDLDLRGEAFDIIDHAFAHTEQHVKKSTFDGINEMTSLRDGLLQFEKDVLNARAGIINGNGP